MGGGGGGFVQNLADGSRCAARALRPGDRVSLCKYSCMYYIRAQLKMDWADGAMRSFVAPTEQGVGVSGTHTHTYTHTHTHKHTHIHSHTHTHIHTLWSRANPLPLYEIYFTLRGLAPSTLSHCTVLFHKTTHPSPAACLALPCGECRTGDNK